LLVDPKDGQLETPAGCLYINRLVQLTPEERSTHRRAIGDKAHLGIGLIGADETIAAQLTLDILQLHPTQKTDSLAERSLFHRRQEIEASVEKLNALIDLPEALFSIDILGVFAAIPLSCSS